MTNGAATAGEPPWESQCPACGAGLVGGDGAPPNDLPCRGCGCGVGFDPATGRALLVVALREKTEGFTTDLIFHDGATPVTFGIPLRDWLRQRGIRRYVLDLAEVHFVGSAVLASMVQLRKHLGKDDALFLRHVHPDIAEVLRITRLDQVFRIIPPS